MHYALKIIIKMLILCILTNIKSCIIIKLQEKNKEIYFFYTIGKTFYQKEKEDKNEKHDEKSCCNFYGSNNDNGNASGVRKQQ